MTSEAILRDVKPLVSRRYTCATSTGIAKGTPLYLSGDQTAAASSTSRGYFVGICHADVNKSTDTNFNTETSVTADSGGIYEMYASGAIVKGALVVGGYGNTIEQAEAALTAASMAIVIGRADEDATSGELINVYVFPR